MRLWYRCLGALLLDGRPKRPEPLNKRVVEADWKPPRPMVCSLGASWKDQSPLPSPQPEAQSSEVPGTSYRISLKRGSLQSMIGVIAPILPSP